MLAIENCNIQYFTYAPSVSSDRVLTAKIRPHSEILTSHLAKKPMTTLDSFRGYCFSALRCVQVRDDLCPWNWNQSRIYFHHQYFSAVMCCCCRYQVCHEPWNCVQMTSTHTLGTAFLVGLLSLVSFPPQTKSGAPTFVKFSLLLSFTSFQNTDLYQK